MKKWRRAADRWSVVGVASMLAVSLAGQQPPRTSVSKQDSSATAPWLWLSPQEIADVPAVSEAPGADPRTWRASLSTAGRHSQAFPGADLLLRGDESVVHALLVLQPGADPAGVRLEFPKALGFETDGHGHVIVRSEGGDIALLRPGLHQNLNQERRAVPGGWHVTDEGTVELRASPADVSLETAVGFDVLFLSAQPALDRNQDGRVSLNELAPPIEPTGGTPSVDATKNDTLVVDNDTDSAADPGDTLRYDIVITNNGMAPATGIVLTDPLGPNLTEVPGSMNVSPLALDDAYQAVGNVTLSVTNPALGLFANDTEFLGDTFFLTSPPVATPFATTQGGTVTVAADGTFTYTPPAGFGGPTDTFNYTISDSGGLTGTATVTFTIAGRVWFVDRDAAPGGNGTQASPFNLLATVNGPGGVGDPDGPSDIIYLYDRAATTDYVGGLQLETGQRLVGSGVALIVSGNTLIPAGTPPVVENTGGNAITLIAGATVDGRPHVEGVTINAANNAAVFGTGALGTLTLDAITLNTSAAGAGLSLTSQTGSVTVTNGSITGTGSAGAVVLSGGTGSVTLTGAPISKTAGRLIDVQSKTGGTVAFGSVTGTGAATDAIFLQTNSATTLNFGSGFSVTTTAGRGLFANNGGTINVTGASSTISATGGAALDVTGTSFGAGATLASASSATSSAEGIKLSNVTGPLTINAGAISGSTGTTFSLALGSANVSYAGTINKTSAGRAVDVVTRAGGTATFSGTITATGASTGINVSGATASSTVTFTGAVDLGTSVTRLTGGTALTVNHNGNGSTTSFSDLDVFTTGQQGIDASNGGTLNVTAGSIDAGGRALNLDGLALGAAFTGLISNGSPAEGVRLNAATGTLTIGTTSVSGPATQGISIAGSSANITFASGAGTTTVSGTGTQRILVGTSTGTVAFGNTTLSGGTDGVSLQNNSAGTRTFSTLGIGGNSAVGFRHAVGGGATTVSGATTITNPSSTGVDIQNSTTAVTFAGGVTVNKGASSGLGVNLVSNSIAPTFGTLNVTTSNGTGVAIGGTGSGLVTSGGSISATNAPAINSTNGAFAATFATVSSATSATQGVTLTGSSGTLTMNGGTLGGSTGTAFNISGGNAVVTYAGTVTVTNGQSGLVTSDVLGGSLTINTVNVSGTGAGRDAVVIDATGAAYDVTVTSATLNTSAMRHGVALSDLGSGSDITFSGGTITSTGAGRRVVNFAGPTNGIYTFGNVTLSASGSDGLNFGSTQLGTYGFRDLNCGTPGSGVCVTGTGNNAAITFRSVAQTGGTNGISLSNTTGSFTVSGDGGGANNASGGTIQNTSAEGILLSTAANVSLGYVDVLNSGTDSIRITNINGFTLNRSNISDSAGTTADKAIDVGDFVTGTAVSGAINLTNDVIGPAVGSSPHDSLAVGISSGTSTWAVTNTTFRNTGNAGINLELHGSAVVSAFNVSNCTFAGAGFATSARGIFANNLNDSVMTLLTVQNSTFTNNNIHTDFNQQNDTDPVGSSEFAMLNNTTMTGARSHAMNIFTAVGAFGGTFEGTTSGNAIGTAAVADSGSAIGNGIRMNVNGGADVSQLLNGNTVRQTPNGRGVEIIGRNGTGGLDVTVTNNNVNPQALANPLAAILVQSNCLTVCNTVRSDVRLNTVPAASDVTDLLTTYIELVESSTSTSELVDSTSPVSGTCASELAATNTGSTGVLGGCALIAGPITTP